MWLSLALINKPSGPLSSLALTVGDKYFKMTANPWTMQGLRAPTLHSQKSMYNSDTLKTYLLIAYSWTEALPIT